MSSAGRVARRWSVPVWLGVASALEHAPEEVRRRARDLLNRPPYRSEPGPLERILDWARERIALFLDRLLGGVTGTTTLAWAVVGLGTVLLGLAVWRWTRGTTVDRSVAAAPPASPRRSAAEWAAEARAHEAAGRRRAAVRSWYGALVATLIERGTVDDVPGRTVRELDREVAIAAPDLAPVVDAAGERFEAVWYGHAEPTEQDVRVIADAVTTAERDAGRVTAVPA